MLHTQISQARKGTRPRDDDGVIGSLGGFTIISTPTWGSGNQVWAHLRFDGVPVPAVRISETELGLTSDKPPVGLITRLENKLADLAADRDKVAEETSRIQAETERARAAVSAPFAHADELSRARAQSDRLADELSGEPSAVPPPAATASETPDASETGADPAGARTAAADLDPGQHASTAGAPDTAPRRPYRQHRRPGTNQPGTRTRHAARSRGDRPRPASPGPGSHAASATRRRPARGSSPPARRSQPAHAGTRPGRHRQPRRAG